MQLASCTDDAASAGLRVKLDATRTAVRSDKPGRGGSRIWSCPQRGAGPPGGFGAPAHRRSRGPSDGPDNGCARSL